MSEFSDRSVAIVGSGPGGMYVAQALLEKAPGCRIDIIDRLPSPFGLIRGGVAPDHQKTKRVDQKYAQSITENDNVRYVGNISLGRDVSLDELTAIYDAVVLAYGAPYDNKLGIPGEDKKASLAQMPLSVGITVTQTSRILDPILISAPPQSSASATWLSTSRGSCRGLLLKCRPQTSLTMR